MSDTPHHNRKGSDEDIIALNALGFSLATIAKRLGCHPTAISLRLKSLGIPAMDTRRAFMEEIITSLPGSPETAILNQLMHADGSMLSIKEYVRRLILNDLRTNQDKTYG